MKFYTVYKTTNKLNGKSYVGKHITDNPNDNYLGSGSILRRAIKRYGVESFLKEVLFVFDNEQEMNDKEAEIVTESWCLSDDTYNVCDGGRGGFSHINRTGLNLRTGAKISKENIEKMRLAKVGKPVWNKGLSKETDQRVLQHAQMLVGKKYRDRGCGR